MTSSMFNQISKTYDRVNRILSLGQDLRWRKQVARELPLRAHLDVLDIATGTGDQLGALLQAGCSIRRAVGVDLADEMLGLARKKFPQIEFLHADAQNLPFADQTFDATTISFGIRNIPDPVQALREMHRVLKPNGKTLVLEFSLPSRWIRPFFLLYLRKILPWLGGFFSKEKKAYVYLNQTIESFPSGENFCALMREAGFRTVSRKTMNFGAVTLYIGEK